MIVVIADDFTGAAELAGISLRYGQTVELFLDSVTQSNAQVVVISADSRSLSKEEALKRISAIVKQVLKLKPSLVYKKVDSVLRGYVVEELKVQMQLTGKQKAFFMPANPSLGRTISNGKYYVNSVPLNETGFATDPEFPIRNAVIKKVFQNEIVVLPLHEVLPEQGIVVGEVNSTEDYKEWAIKTNESWLLSGAGDFFTALLDKLFTPVVTNSAILKNPFLYVCGTAFAERKTFIKKIDESKESVCYLNEGNEAIVINKAIETSKVAPVILAFEDVDFTMSAYELRHWMAIVVKKIIVGAEICELFIEGGSTAAAIIHELGITILEPVNELSRGMVRMKSGELFITVKPGSYQLPEEIKRLFTT